MYFTHRVREKQTMIPEKHFAVAVDGPSGAGKSTLAKAIAAKLGILYVDTGAIYRTIGYAVKRRGIEPHDEAAVRAILPELEIGMRYEADGEQHMLLNGQDVTREIRLPEISMYASAVSALPAVRAFLLEMQRDLARKHSVIMDGRDIGTVVFPEAPVKLYVTASPEERGRRRGNPQQPKPGTAVADRVPVRAATHDEMLVLRLATRPAATGQTSSEEPTHSSTSARAASS